jgi:hypothetical protein
VASWSIAASRLGLRFVTGDVFGFLAADLQGPPGQMLQMGEHWLAGDKFVISVRPYATIRSSRLAGGLR